MTRYTLPDLPYDYGALEPHISGKIMQLHHDKHHKAYVDNANKAIEKMLELRTKKDFTQVAAIERTLAFNVSGHVLHALFWRNLMPKGGGEPEGELADAIRRDFGSFDLFKQQLTAVSGSIMGSGWGALVWEPSAQRLGTVQIHDHQSQITQGCVPLMVVDAWEHAYYLQYQTDKAKYFEALWNLWNWEDISTRFAAAQELELGLDGTAERTVAAEHILPH
jgi:Fe-Mn family superoxide dismutase